VRKVKLDKEYKGVKMQGHGFRNTEGGQSHHVPRNTAMTVTMIIGAIKGNLISTGIHTQAEDLVDIAGEVIKSSSSAQANSRLALPMFFLWFSTENLLSVYVLQE